MKPIHIYTDGSCKGNPGPGGWAAVHSLKGQEHYICGGEADTTNNRMELMAAIQGLVAVQTHYPQATHFVIHSDSTYLINTITLGWKRRVNNDLWDQLDAVIQGKNVAWYWVRGHNGNSGNERADAIAQQEAKRWRSITT